MWHHAQFRGEELLVLGHNPRNNDCMLVRLSGLPMNEGSDLRKIASSRSAQSSNYLIPILQRMESPSGGDWFSYLCKKMEQRNSPVFVLPIKEIQDTLDQDQKAIFKGYGKGRKNSGLETEDFARSQTGGFDPEDEPKLSMMPIPAPEATAVEHKIDSLVESTKQTNALLSQLVNVMMADKQVAPTTKKAKVARKPRAKTTPTSEVA